MKKYLPSIVSGFGAGVLQIVPFVKSFSCCFIMPIAAFLALILDQKANHFVGRILTKKAVVVGLMTGLFAAIFGSTFEIFITFVTRQNDIIAAFPDLQRMLDTFPITDDIKREVLYLFQNVRTEILTTGFSWIYTFSILVNNFTINLIFGAIGGLVGAQIINSRTDNSQDNF